MATIKEVPKARYSQRIRDNFCSQCKHKRSCTETGCKKYIPGNGECLQFEWQSEKIRTEHINEVLDNQSHTLWLNRGKTLEEIKSMSKNTRRSLLTKRHYSQFNEADSERARLLVEYLEKQEEQPTLLVVPKQPRASQATPAAPIVSTVSAIAFTSDIEKVEESPKAPEPTPEPTPAPEPASAPEPTYHYLYCQLPDGTEKVYKRSLHAPSYEGEIKAFKKYLSKNNIAILKEEKK